MSQLLVKRDEYTPTGWDIISTYLTVQIYSNFAFIFEKSPNLKFISIWRLITPQAFRQLKQKRKSLQRNKSAGDSRRKCCAKISFWAFTDQTIDQIRTSIENI